MKKLKIFIIICLILLLIPLIINFIVVFSNKNRIYNGNDIKEKYDYGLVLGCGVHKDGSPSKMLEDRLNTALSLYENNKINKVILSGHHSIGYSEVDTMYNYLRKKGISVNDLIRDDSGFSTSESLENYKKNYEDKSVIIITQQYHLYRALHIANRLNLNAVGVYAKLVNYSGQFSREIREILARNKDFFKYMFV